MGASSSHLGKGASGFSLNQVANATHFTKEELAALDDHFMAAAKESGSSSTITREQFKAVLASQNITSANTGYLDVLFDVIGRCVSSDHFQCSESGPLPLA